MCSSQSPDFSPCAGSYVFINDFAGVRAFNIFTYFYRKIISNGISRHITLHEGSRMDQH